MRILNADKPIWTSMLDADGQLKLWCGRKVVWEGTYEAFIADGDIQPPKEVVDAIHAKAERLHIA